MGKGRIKKKKKKKKIVFLFPVFMFLLFMSKISNTPELSEHNVVKQYKLFVWLISYFFLLLLLILLLLIFLSCPR